MVTLQSHTLEIVKILPFQDVANIDYYNFSSMLIIQTNSNLPRTLVKVLLNIFFFLVPQSLPFITTSRSTSLATHSRPFLPNFLTPK